MAPGHVMSREFLGLPDSTGGLVVTLCKPWPMTIQFLALSLAWQSIHRTLSQWVDQFNYLAQPRIPTIPTICDCGEPVLARS